MHRKETNLVHMERNIIIRMMTQHALNLLQDVFSGIVYSSTVSCDEVYVYCMCVGGGGGGVGNHIL
jgi:hypothetical protein